MSLLSVHLLSGVEDGHLGELAAVLHTAEQLLQRGREADFDVVIVGLIESLHNGVSHCEDSVEEVVTGHLSPACKEAWQGCREFYGRVAEWVRESGGSSQGIEAGLDSASPALRHYFQSDYWRSPSGDYIGLGDVLSFETALATGEAK